MVKILPEVGPDQKIKVGDLIYFPGHVMIVSDLAKNLFIESAGYSVGFGIVP